MAASRAAWLAGLGSANLRLIDQLADGSVDVPAAMRAAIETDLRAGLRPFLIVGTAGSVDIGSIDDLHALADLAAEFGLHYHVDGAIGALCALAATGAQVRRHRAGRFHRHGFPQVDARAL
jgi:glutamate/tyrosine decarboxylase-like PLP-dependent enzyme